MREIRIQRELGARRVYLVCFSFYLLLGRGTSVERKMESGSLTVFAGSTSNG